MNNQQPAAEGDPLVSVCIPSYNSAAHIQETIRSVFAQTYRNIELIISDDGSTDTTVEEIHAATRDCPFPLTIRVLENNTGIAENWNLALSLAQGDFIKLLPGDDILAADCIESQLAQFDLYGESIALTFCARRIITRSGKALLTARFYGNEFIKAKQLVQRSIAAGTNPIGEPGAVLFRKALADKIGPFDGTRPYVIDIDYWLRLLKYGDAASIHAVLSSFRIDQNLSVRIGWNRCAQYLSFCSDNAKLWNISPLILAWGRVRTVLNELLRRVVHIAFRIIG